MKASTHHKRLSYFLTTLLACTLISATVFAAPSYRPKKPKETEQTQAPAKSARELRAEKLFDNGIKFMDAQKWAQAAKQFDSACKLNPKFAESFSNLGYCLRKQEKYQEAIEKYLIAIDLDPKLATAREYIGEAYVELAISYREKAMSELNTLKKLDSEQAKKLADFMAAQNFEQ